MRSKPRSAPIRVVHILLVAADGGDQGVARKLTDETGGRMIVVRSEKNLEQAFDEISEELRSQYTIGYTPTNKAHDGSLPENQSGNEEQGVLRSYPPRLLRTQRVINVRASKARPEALKTAASERNSIPLRARTITSLRSTWMRIV